MDNVPISIIILTFNEEANIRACLESCKCLIGEILVVDSFSTDKTLEIVREYTDKIYQNTWIDWAHQRNWALEHLPLSQEWILFLDADERITREFSQELQEKIAASAPVTSAMNVHFAFYFLGRLLRFAYESPPVLRVIRRGRVSWQGEGAREYASVEGEVLDIKSRLMHRDQKGLTAWITKQTGNALRETRLTKTQDLTRNENQESKGNQTRERPLRRLLRAKVWSRLPRLWRSFPYFFYRYIIRGGFLDGKAGFAYCFLHGLWYPLLIDLMIIENCTSDLKD